MHWVIKTKQISIKIDQSCLYGELYLLWTISWYLDRQAWYIPEIGLSYEDYQTSQNHDHDTNRDKKVYEFFADISEIHVVKKEFWIV